MNKDNLKYRVWSEKSKKYCSDHLVVDFEGDLWDTANGEFIWVLDQDTYQPEMCTGFKDDRQNLIYENDIVEDSDKKRWTVIWYRGGWLGELCDPGTNTREYRPLDDFFWCVVVGNIHEGVKENS